MTVIPAAPAENPALLLPSTRGGGSLWRAALRSSRVQVGTALLLPLLVLVFLGPHLAPHDPNEFLGGHYARPGHGLHLGTDQLGRDVLSRLLVGGRSTVIVAALATLLGVAAGTILGLLTALASAKVSDSTMRLLDAVIAFPQFVLVLLFVSMFGSHSWLTVLLVAAIWAPQVARVIRAAALSVIEQDFVRFSRSIGVSRTRMIFVEVLPSITAPLSVEFGVRLTYSIALVAGLGFLGFGPPPPTADWGTMITENQAGLAIQPWASLSPVLCIAALTVATNLIADGLAQVSATGGSK